MYLDNKYTRWYYSIIKAAQKRVAYTGYREKHHIIPRSLGGIDCPTNLVLLTGREHFLCHWLLIKMLEGPARDKMILALRMMRVTSRDHKGERYLSIASARVFERYREEHARIHSAYMKGKPNWKKGLKMGPLSEETRLKISISNKGKNAGRPSHFKGKPQLESTKAKKRKPKPVVECPHCYKTGGKSAMERWHFSNCRSLVSAEYLEPRKS